MSLEVLLVFAVTEFLLSLTPGPAVLLVIAQGMRYGFAPSIRGALGILTGNAIYFVLSALGLGAVLMASSTLFLAIKWMGAVYLIYIGVTMLLGRGGGAEPDTPAMVTSRRAMQLFSQGLLTQLANPKALIFFTALLPQFVSASGQVFEQFLCLGVVSIAVEGPVLLAYGWLAERGKRLLPHGRLSALPERVAGGFWVGAGVGLALLKRP